MSVRLGTQRMVDVVAFAGGFLVTAGCLLLGYHAGVTYRAER